MTPYWSSKCGRWTVYHGDCLEVLPTLSGVDAVVTDPPYGTGAWKRAAAGSGKDCRATMQREEWDEWDASWVDRTDAPVVGFFLPQTRLGDFRRMFLWVKSDPRPRFAGQPAYGFEPFVIYRGTPREIGGNDWVMASAPRLNRDHDGTGHPHQKPIKVVEWCVELCADPDALVLDPFTGSGTTGVACVKTGRRFIGIEISEEYCEIAVKRIEKEAAHLFAEVQP